MNQLTILSHYSMACSFSASEVSCNPATIQSPPSGPHIPDVQQTVIPRPHLEKGQQFSSPKHSRNSKQQ